MLGKTENRQVWQDFPYDLNSMPIHVLQYVIHAQKRSCTHLSFGTYVQKRRVIFVHA